MYLYGRSKVTDILILQRLLTLADALIHFSEIIFPLSRFNLTLKYPKFTFSKSSVAQLKEIVNVRSDIFLLRLTLITFLFSVVAERDQQVMPEKLFLFPFFTIRNSN